MGDVDPRFVHLNSNSIVKWRCRKTNSCGCTHQWRASISKRAKGFKDPTRLAGKRGICCPYCVGVRPCCVVTSLYYTHRHLRSVAADPNELMLRTKHSLQTIEWKCTKSSHICGCIHKWRSTYETYKKKKQPCPYCSTYQSIHVCCEKHTAAYQHPQLVKQVHETNEGEHNILFKVKPSSTKKITWICTIHSEPVFWKASIRSRTQDPRCRCSRCKGSKLERRMAAALDKLGVRYHREWRVKINDDQTIRYDFFVTSPEQFLIEMDGKGHSGPVQYGGVSKSTAQEIYKATQEKDLLKNNHAIHNLQLGLLRINHQVPYKYYTKNVTHMIDLVSKDDYRPKIHVVS
jgi:hypothetical protein